MNRQSRPKLLLGAFLPMIMAVLAVSGADAQTPPRPTFDLTQHPDLYINVWPADVNRDGKADLVAGTRALFVADPGDVVVAMGRGDGTFLAPKAVDYRAEPLLPADFNADGFVDLLILRGRSLEVLPGNGDGTFDAARVIDANDQVRELRTWGFAGDLNGDRHLDIIVPDVATDAVLKLYPGTGTFAFGPPIILPTSNYLPAELTSGDFNGDGRRDLALANTCCEINLFINNGGNLFTRTDIPGNFNDITAFDLNADGRLDLAAVSGIYDVGSPGQAPGQVVVLLGNGDGTFGTGVSYSTGVRGGTSVVVGDFNGDARPDVATGNRSIIWDDDLGFALSDSVSVLPGDGTGRLLAPDVFALAYIYQGQFGTGYDRSSPYWGANNELNTSDLNGDRRTDLITSPGATLLNRAPRTNRPPSVFAGPDRTSFTNDPWVDVGTDARDPDWHWLSYTWTDEHGQVISRRPFVRVLMDAGMSRTVTVTVEDGRGGSASDAVTIHSYDSDADAFVGVSDPNTNTNVQAGVPYTVRFATGPPERLTRLMLSYSVDDGRTFSPVLGCENLPPTALECVWSSPGPVTDRARLRLIGEGSQQLIAISERFAILADPPLPARWSSTDIGAVGTRGNAAFAGGTWTVEGSGADIWSTADEFRYVYLTAGSQFTFTARVAGIENLDRWVKAGIMVREDLSAGARHVSLFATPGTANGLAFQRRLEPSAVTAHTAGPRIAPPVWLRIGRAGDTVSAYYRVLPSQPWILIGRQVVADLRNVLYVGLAVTSHVDGQLATASFDNVTLESGDPLTRKEDVGSVGVAGSTTFDGVVYEVRASGADIWGTADAFHFAFSQGYYSFVQSISARVRSVQNTDPWAKAGVMFRELYGAGPWTLPEARHVMVVATPGHGVAMQYREAVGGRSFQVAVRTAATPVSVALTRSGDTFTGWYSKDGATWQQVGQVTLAGVFVAPGLVVTSHNNAVRATATFDDVRLVPY